MEDSVVLNGVKFPNNWKISPISDLCDFIVDCLHSTPATQVFFTGFYMARTSDIGNGRVNLETARYVNENVYERRIRRGTPKKHDLIITREAPMGNIGQILTDDKICLGQRMIHYRPNPKRVHPRYLTYSLLSPAIQHEFEANRGTGSVVDNLLMDVARSLPIPLPPLPTQRRIAHILGTLDDKIEVNRRMNSTLEAMASAIFKSWFVDFDPVRAKMDGRDTGLPDIVAALFPDGFAESEVGKIPREWEVKNIGDVVEAVGGGTPSTKNPNYWEGGEFAFATPKDLSGLESSILLATDRKVTKDGLEKISSGLLPAGTVLMSSRAPVGYLAIARIPVCVNQGFIAMKCNAVSNLFILNWAKTNMSVIEMRASGTTFAEISKKNFRPIPILLPGSKLLSAFNDAVRPIYQQVEANLLENHTLSALRDTLLPKLMRGEIELDSQ